MQTTDDRPRIDAQFFDRLNAGEVPPKGAMAEATLISNGHDVLTVPTADLDRIDAETVRNLTAGDEKDSVANDGSGIAVKNLTPFTDEQARLCLTAFNIAKQPRLAIRKLADAWGWHKSKVERFLSRFDAETPPETKAVVSPKPSPPDDEFNWSDVEVLIPHQPAIAVYFNPRGEVVIRQEGHYGPDEDAFVYIQIQNLQPLIEKLTAISRGEIVPAD